MSYNSLPINLHVEGNLTEAYGGIGINAIL